MNTKRVLLVTIALLGLSNFAFSQQEQTSGILYGPNWACLVTAPTGWIMDQDTWAKNHIYGLFYAKGSPFSSKIPIVYINTQKLDAPTDEELQKFVDWDRANAAKNKNNTVTERKLNLTLDRKVVCYDFNFGGQQFETIAYLRYKDTCFLVVMATHDKTVITATLPKLLEAIQNMKFMDKT